MKIEIEAMDGDRPQLYQWDLNRRLILSGFGPDTDTQAHFGSLVVEAYEDGGVLYADIPNICLQRAGMLYVYIYNSASTRTRTAAAFSVWARPKPEDYVYTETETLTYRKLEAKIGDLENLNTNDKSSLVSAVNEALKTSGGYGAVTYTEQNLTDAQQSQARKNIGALGTEALPGAINDALAQAKESGAFDGAPGKDGSDGKDGAPGANGSDGVTPTIGDNGNWYLGGTDTGKPSRGETGPAGADGRDGADGQPGADGKSAYQYAVEGGYTGTEAEFATKLAAEKFANPNALTFTGAVTGSYDGSEAVSVEIPSGGGGSSGGYVDTIIADIEITEEVSTYRTSTLTSDQVKALKNADIIYFSAKLEKPSEQTGRGKLLASIYGSYYHATKFFYDGAAYTNATPSSSAYGGDIAESISVKNEASGNYFQTIKWKNTDNQYGNDGNTQERITIVIPQKDPVFNLSTNTVFGVGTTAKLIARRFL